MLFTVSAQGFTTGNDSQVHPFSDFALEPEVNNPTWGGFQDFSPWPNRIAILGTGGGTPEQHVAGGITYHPPFTRTASMYSIVNPPPEDHWHYEGTVRNNDDPTGFTTTIDTADDLVPVQILTQEFYGDLSFFIRLHPAVDPPVINNELANGNYNGNQLERQAQQGNTVLL